MANEHIAPSCAKLPKPVMKGKKGKGNKQNLDR